MRVQSSTVYEKIYRFFEKFSFFAFENGSILNNIKFDSEIAAYLIDPLSTEYVIERLCSENAIEYNSSDENADIYTLSYRPEDVGATQNEPFRIMARRGLFDGEATAKADNVISRLGIGPLAPEQFLFVIPQ